MAGHRADDEIVTVDGDRTQLADQIVDVDQVLRSGEAELHHREQAVPAGDHARVRAELLEERDRMVDAGRAFVRERCWNLHGYLLLWVRVPRAQPDGWSLAPNRLRRQLHATRSGLRACHHSACVRDRSASRHRRAMATPIRIPPSRLTMSLKSLIESPALTSTSMMPTAPSAITASASPATSRSRRSSHGSSAASVPRADQGRGHCRGRGRHQHDDVLRQAEEAEDLDPLTPHAVLEARGRDRPRPVDDGGGDRQLGEREQPADLGEQTRPVLALAVRHRTRPTTQFTRRTGGA